MAKLSLDDRLNQIEDKISEKSFRENKGLGNEVGYYIFDYDPREELYAKAEGTTQRVFVYVKVGNPVRDDKIESLHKFRLENGENPPKLFVIDSQKQTSASKR